MKPLPNYEPMTPPFHVPPFAEMSLDTAQRHFTWFVAQAEARIDALISLCAKDGVQLAGEPSIESIRLLCVWLCKQIVVVNSPLPNDPKTREFLKIIGDTPVDFSTTTRSLIVDSSFYVAKFFLAQSENVKWELCRKKGPDLNQPVLTGFGRLSLVPSHLVAASAWKWAGNPPGPAEALLRGIEAWCRDLPPPELTA